jgi:hypothetical protein
MFVFAVGCVNGYYLQNFYHWNFQLTTIKLECLSKKTPSTKSNSFRKGGPSSGSTRVGLSYCLTNIRPGYKCPFLASRLETRTPDSYNSMLYRLGYCHRPPFFSSVFLNLCLSLPFKFCWPCQRTLITQLLSV